MKNNILILCLLFTVTGCILPATQPTDFINDLNLGKVDGGEKLTILIHEIGITRPGKVLSVWVVCCDEDGKNCAVASVPFTALDTRNTKCEFIKNGVGNHKYVVIITTNIRTFSYGPINSRG